jgi:UPF0755 protein
MKSVLVTIFILLVLAVVAIAGVSYWTYRTVNTSVVHTHGNDFITIQKGATPREIVDQLAEAGIIPSQMATMLYLRTVGDGSKLQAGEYQFASPITTLQVLKQLEKGQDATIKLTIPEGFTRFDIAKRICEKGFPMGVIQDKRLQCDTVVLGMMDDTSLIKDIAPTATNLEGYMYPSTYSLQRDTLPWDIIKTMVGQFRKVWTPEFAAQAALMHRTPHEIATIASLIETETGVETERPIVAGVIYNRLNRNTPLGIDQTNVYIAKMLGKWDGTIHKSDLEVDSPYNTRIKTGLPPGPISSVSESSIKAALYPQTNDYFFYVRNVDLNDGSHWFYASAAEFEKGKAKYQQWLEQQRAEKKAEQSNNSNDNQ